MPELPEVETVARHLTKHIIGKRIVDYKQFRNNIRYTLDDKLSKRVNQQQIIDVVRKAKYIVILLENDYAIIIHLGMSGRLLIKNPPYIIQKHDHVVFSCSDSIDLVFNDPRRFGMVYCVTQQDINKQCYFEGAVEPLTSQFNAQYLYRHSNSRRSIKQIITDNKIVVGIGNIYAVESLFLSGISPLRLMQDVTIKELESLVDNLKKILSDAIIFGGSSIRDFVGIDESKGSFQNNLMVYGRHNKDCIICKTAKIQMIRQSGRSSYYCPFCQK
jgi:formamidopyrimidine-DNA glycosylase